MTRATILSRLTLFAALLPLLAGRAGMDIDQAMSYAKAGGQAAGIVRPPAPLTTCTSPAPLLYTLSRSSTNVACPLICPKSGLVQLNVWEWPTRKMSAPALRSRDTTCW